MQDFHNQPFESNENDSEMRRAQKEAERYAKKYGGTWVARLRKTDHTEEPFWHVDCTSDKTKHFPHLKLGKRAKELLTELVMVVASRWETFSLDVQDEDEDGILDYVFNAILMFSGAPDDRNPSGDNGYRAPSDFCHDGFLNLIGDISKEKNLKTRRRMATSFVKEAIKCSVYRTPKEEDCRMRALHPYSYGKF